MSDIEKAQVSSSRLLISWSKERPFLSFGARTSLAAPSAASEGRQQTLCSLPQNACSASCCGRVSLGGHHARGPGPAVLHGWLRSQADQTDLQVRQISRPSDRQELLHQAESGALYHRASAKSCSTDAAHTTSPPTHGCEHPKTW